MLRFFKDLHYRLSTSRYTKIIRNDNIESDLVPNQSGIILIYDCFWLSTQNKLQRSSEMPINSNA